MIKKLVAALLIAGVAYIFWIFFDGFDPSQALPLSSSHYANNGISEVGAANLVTAVVVTYRGLDTVGEVTILFLTTVILGFFLKTGLSKKNDEGRQASEILVTGAGILIPAVFLLGIYIFVNGHLTPGGGFQGGAVIASGTLLLLLADPLRPVSQRMIKWVESLSGMVFIGLGLLGILLAGGFLDNRILPLGTAGDLLSAGAIPLVYSLIGLKVGAELSGILTTFKNSREGDPGINA